MRFHAGAALLLLACLSGCHHGGTDGSDEEMAYETLVFVPDQYDPGSSWPLILFLHGALGGNDAVPQGPLAWALEHPDFPFIVLQPLSPSGFEHAPLMAVLEDARAAYNVDRVYLTGLSWGARDTWAIAIDYPEAFAALAPVCGGGDPDHLDVCRLVDVPVWAFHNERDPVVPIEETQCMVEALIACGGDALLTAYPSGSHDAWTAAYQDPALYEWFLAN
jgi:predicted peptidase